jgi:hypothetical protein
MKTSTDSKIVAIRVANGGSADRCCTCGHAAANCCTCGHAAANPYRRIAEGKIVEGCIDATHTGHLQPTSSTLAWHDRKQAVAMRRAELARLSRYPSP